MTGIWNGANNVFNVQHNFSSNIISSQVRHSLYTAAVEKISLLLLFPTSFFVLRTHVLSEAACLVNNIDVDFIQRLSRWTFQKRNFNLVLDCSTSLLVKQNFTEFQCIGLKLLSETGTDMLCMFHDHWQKTFKFTASCKNSDDTTRELDL